MPNIPAKKICLIRLSALGDAVHALALANGLRQGYPDSHLTWIIQTLPYELVKYQPCIDQFIIVDKKGGFGFWKNLSRQLKKDRFDLAIIPQVSFRSSFITALIQSDIKLGFDFNRSRELSWAFTNRHIQPRKPGHVQDQFFEFLDYLGISDYKKEWNFVFTQEELNWQKEFFARIQRPVVSFVAATSDPEKDWNAPGYAAVMDYVDLKLGFQPLIVGGPSKREHEIAGQILEKCICKPVVALEKPVRKTLLQLAGSAMVVSPDTGPLHAAVALNVPTVGLYGPSDPRRCGPYEKYKDLLIDKYKNPGEENNLITRKLRKGRMLSITPEEVMEKIRFGLEKYVRS
jgi:heptosyltransferase I